MKTSAVVVSCAIWLSGALAAGCGSDVSLSTSSGDTTGSGGQGGASTTSTGGGGTETTGSGAAGGAETTGTAGAGGTGSGGTTGTGGTGGSPTKDCKGLADAIAQETSGVKTCTSVVRLDYQTLAIKAYRILCGPYGATNESAARATAEADTGFGQAGQFLSGPNPEDEYVFFESPGDFGGVGVVNARNGDSVFGGGIVWSGMGQISYPDTFDSPGGLGKDCTNASSVPAARGFDLSSGQALAMDKVTAALDVVWDTALPDGLWQGGYVFDAVVLLYPPSVGVLDPTVAEWVVLVNSGWLE